MIARWLESLSRCFHRGVSYRNYDHYDGYYR